MEAASDRPTGPEAGAGFAADAGVEGAGMGVDRLGVEPATGVMVTGGAAVAEAGPGAAENNGGAARVSPAGGAVTATVGEVELATVGGFTVEASWAPHPEQANVSETAAAATHAYPRGVRTVTSITLAARRGTARRARHNGG